MAATMKQIAELAGVSTTTVDRALKNRGRIDPEVAKRIREIAKNLDYKPNTVAKSLALRHKNLTFALILHVKEHHFYEYVVKGVEMAADNLADCGIKIIIKRCKNFDYEEQLRLINECITNNITGFAIIPIDHPVIHNKINELVRNDYPVVFISRNINDIRNLAYIGHNYEKANEILTGLIHILADEPAKIVNISNGRKGSFQKVEEILWEKYPNIHSFDSIYSVTNSEKEYEDTLNGLMKNKNVNIILTTSSPNKLKAIKKFILSQQRKIKVIARNYFYLPEQQEYNDLITCSIVHNPISQGYQAMMVLFNFVTLNQVPSDYNLYIESQIIIKQSSYRCTDFGKFAL